VACVTYEPAYGPHDTITIDNRYVNSAFDFSISFKPNWEICNDPKSESSSLSKKWREIFSICKKSKMELLFVARREAGPAFAAAFVKSTTYELDQYIYRSLASAAKKPNLKVESKAKITINEVPLYELEYLDVKKNIRFAYLEYFIQADDDKILRLQFSVPSTIYDYHKDEFKSIANTIRGIAVAEHPLTEPQKPGNETQKSVSISSEVSEPKIMARDDTYIAYATGVVYDKNTGLEWYAGPDWDTNWYEAKRWVESLEIAGGGWRMPTIKELKSLYQEGLGLRNMTTLLETTGWYVWTGEWKGPSNFYKPVFNYGYIISGETHAVVNESKRHRVFAVRSRR
jgi:hypothetical protein